MKRKNFHRNIYLATILLSSATKFIVTNNQFYCSEGCLLGHEIDPFQLFDPTILIER